MSRRTIITLVMIALGLCLGLGILLLRIYRDAERSTRNLLSDRLEAIGLTAATLLPSSDRERVLAGIVAQHRLDACYLFDRTYVVRVDARGGTPHPLNRMRLDPARVSDALAGRASVGWAFDVEDQRFLGGYFPVPDGVLVLEAGVAFTQPLAELARSAGGAGAIGLGLFGLFVVAIGAVARASSRERAAFAEAERAAVASQLAAMVAHEVRNPLGTILANAQLLGERAEGNRELAKDIADEVDRLNWLTEDFLQLASPRTLQQQPLALAPLLGSLAELVRRRAPDITVSIHGDARALVDARRMRQVFLNLLLNAVEAMAGTGAIRITLVTVGNEVIIEIRDTGPGLSEAIRERLFQPFMSGKETGHGLGLTVVKTIVEQHGGALRYLPGQGATFEVRLTAALANREEEAQSRSD